MNFETRVGTHGPWMMVFFLTSLHEPFDLQTARMMCMELLLCADPNNSQKQWRCLS